MLPKNHRLPKKEIENVAKRGKLFPGGILFIRVLYFNEATIPQFAIAISTKVHKRSHVRNAIKRKMREAIRSLVSEGFFKPAHYLFVVKDSSLELITINDYKELIKKCFYSNTSKS